MRVVIDHRPPQPNVSYIDQIIGENVDGVEFSYFTGTLRDATDGVVHVLQPFRLVGGRGSAPAGRDAEAQRLVGTLRDRGIPLVQTLYGNHQGAGTAWRQTLDDATTTFIAVDELTQTPDAERTTVIPYAHYRERFVGYPTSERVAGRILCISPSRLVKVAAGPLKVFPLTNTPGLTLRVVGESHAALADLIPRVLARHAETVSVLLGLVSDATMVAEISAAELVMLPDLESLPDLSLLLLALSLDRPVLLPDSEATRRISEEVGPGWIHHHPGAVTAEFLDEIIETVRTSDRAERPNLDARAPEEVAAAYASAYRAAVRNAPQA